MITVLLEEWCGGNILFNNVNISQLRLRYTNQFI